MSSVKEMTARIAEIARDNVDHQLTPEGRSRLVNEVETLRGDLYELAEGKRFHPDAPDLLPAPAYLDEKLVGLCSFTRMALGAEERGSYTPEKIIENVVLYQHQINGLIS